MMIHVFMDTNRGSNAPRCVVHREKGASLIEVLVAILLVSIGLLGIAGLSSASFSYNKTAQIRLIGMALVNDLADRARVNVYGYDLGDYSIALSKDFASSPVEVNANNLNLDPSNDAQAKVLAEDLASADVDDFLRSVRARLPQGDAVVVSRPSAASRDLEVWLLWAEPSTDEANKETDKGNFALFEAGQGNCPNDLSEDDKKKFSCIFFKVGL